MQRVERQSRILERISEDRSVDVASLAAGFAVSQSTVRRDLQLLEHTGLLVRTHGGATASDRSDQVPTQLKAARRQDEKRRIGRAAADLVPDGAVVGMTGGTTTLELARFLADRAGITLVTNAVNVAADLVGRPGLRLIVIGGIARQSGELVGPAADAMLSNYHLDVAFIGVDGLSAVEGCTTYDEMEAATDRAFLARAKRSIVIADSSKISVVTFARIAPLSAIDVVVTDNDAAEEQVAGLRSDRTQVVTV
jgi:DeoR family transcriptional regulator, aga operon transcriptional repressor